MRQLSLFSPEISIKNGNIHGPLAVDTPIIVSNGVGVDSIALLIELHRRRITPDAIVTALVGREWFGNEHRRFYQYLPILEQWLAEARFPAINYVWYGMKRRAKHFPYWSLAGNCLANRTLPSISFRRHHSCSIKYKGAEIDRWVTAQYGDQPCYRLVGYDASEGYRVSRFSTKKKKKGARANDVYIYPLQLWGIDRAGCEAIIASANLPSPGLSSCVFCAAMHAEEIDELHPEELWLIVILEAHAQIKLKKIRGLWGHGERMSEYIHRRGLLPAPLLAETWVKWSAEERPSEFETVMDNADHEDDRPVADVILFDEVHRLAALCAAPMGSG